MNALKKGISPERHRQAEEQVQKVLNVYVRRAFRFIGQPRAYREYGYFGTVN